jgi:hypothetical protein
VSDARDGKESTVGFLVKVATPQGVAFYFSAAHIEDDLIADLTELNAGLKEPFIKRCRYSFYLCYLHKK